MITIRRSQDRGHANHGWLDTYHTFSFADYYDPEQMGFRSLRVINEDRVRPGAGFPTHPHRDMEIVTYVLDGAIAHKDSMGNGSVIEKGEVQRMTAGTGVTHSEFNASKSEPLHLVQIWILPEQAGLRPGYEQLEVPEEEKRSRLRRVASRSGGDGAVQIHQDADLYLAVLQRGDELGHPLRPGRAAWLQVLRGTIDLHGERMVAGDGAAITDVQGIPMTGLEDDSEVLLFDLA